MNNSEIKLKGWVYVITNKAMPNIVKVGFSTKDPELRAQELNNTGSPHPYEVKYEVLVYNPKEVEQKAHSLLKQYHENKEWFCCSIDIAIEAIRNAGEGSIILDDFINQSVKITQQMGHFLIQEGIAIDKRNGLMWLRFSGGQTWENGTISDDAITVNWDDAFELAEEFNRKGGYGGFKDWRVPTHEELKTLLTQEKQNGVCIDNAVFPNTPSDCYWSSSPVAGDDGGAWLVDFYNGYDDWFSKNYGNYVRLVRGGQ